MNNRLANGGTIDRSQPITFHFDGRELTGYTGDTLASALLSNGIFLIGRSFKYHRPRGIVGIGSEEPNALIQTGKHAYGLPNQKATEVELYQGLIAYSQNRWPTLRFDIGAITGLFSSLIPAGFYYKTFMWPPSFWERLYEPLIRRVAGLGNSSIEPDPYRYQKSWLHCDVLVIGGGISGLLAAEAAASNGMRVVLCEARADWGGWIQSQKIEIDNQTAPTWLSNKIEQLESFENLTLLSRTTVFARYDDNVYAACERVNDHIATLTEGQPRQQMWRIMAKRTIYACGALERPLVFNNNDRPGIMLASALQHYVNHYAVKPGNKVLLFTNNDSAYRVATDLISAGIEVTAIVDSRPQIADELTKQLKLHRVKNYRQCWIADVKGVRRVRSALIRSDNSKDEWVDSDIVAVSGGWDPQIQLLSTNEKRPRYDSSTACFVASNLNDDECVIGAAKADFDLASTVSAAIEAAYEAVAGIVGNCLHTDSIPMIDSTPYHITPLWHTADAGSKAFVDMQHDVTLHDIQLAAREGYHSVELLKRYTTLGMGTDQGRLSNVNALAILAKIKGRSITDTGTTTFRPPIVPVTLGVFSGTSRERHFQPTRLTPMHHWAEHNGAIFQQVGHWLRPWYYPRDGEDLHQASIREVNATRSALGICDISTLGKIEIQGPDSAEFLNRLYSNGWLTLPEGKARYGLMLREDGLVFDDGTTSRLGPSRYFMTTTTTNAAAVMAHMEYYHQCIWPDLDLQLTSASDQWAAMALVGPNSHALLEDILGESIDLSNQCFPFLGARDFEWQGMGVRLLRISFSGELAYELYVPAGYGESVWQILIDAGKKYGITPYGLEALAIMRIEKGHVAGAELNGQTSAFDLGLGSMMSTKKKYIGSVLARRPALLTDDREQLVGIQPVDATESVWEGAHLFIPNSPVVADHDQGHVTSACYSPTLNSWIALALLKNGRSRIGERIKAVDLLHSREVLLKVVHPCFFDPQHLRLNLETAVDR